MRAMATPREARSLRRESLAVWSVWFLFFFFIYSREIWPRCLCPTSCDITHCNIRRIVLTQVVRCLLPSASPDVTATRSAATTMVSAEEAAAAKVQSMKRGNDARNQVKEGKAARKVQAMQRGKKSRKGGDALVHVIETGNFARFEKLMESGAEATPDALRAALNSPIRAFGSMLVSNQATWGVDHKMLEVWNRVQKALYPPPPGEDEEEPEEVDVSSEEWQAELATAVYKDDPDGKFFVQRVVALGCYSKSGGRQAHDPTKEKEFDDAVTAREGYGVALMPKGAVYAGHFVAGAREGTGVYKYMDGACYCKP